MLIALIAISRIDESSNTSLSFFYLVHILGTCCRVPQYTLRHQGLHHRLMRVLVLRTNIVARALVPTVLRLLPSVSVLRYPYLSFLVRLPHDPHVRPPFPEMRVLAHLHFLDHIRPDWEAKLAAVRATATRRANRRIIMRQVGDRLIPVGVTSGRVHPLAGEVQFGENGDNANENEGRGSRRSRRRQPQQQPQDLNQLLGTMGLGGQDLEEVGFLIIILF